MRAVLAQRDALAAQREAVREQLLEGEPLLRSMRARQQRRDVGIDRWAMHGKQGLAQIRKSERSPCRIGQQLEFARSWKRCQRESHQLHRRTGA